MNFFTPLLLTFIASSLLLVATTTAEGAGGVLYPAWVYKANVEYGKAGSNTAPAGPIYAGLTGKIGYLLLQTQDKTSGNTTVCAVNIKKNTSCEQIALNLPGVQRTFDEIVLASIHEGFLFTDKSTTTGIRTTYKWSPYKGVEWQQNRGIVERASFVLDEYANNMIWIEGTDDGTTELLSAAGTVNHKYEVFWFVNLPIPTAKQVKNKAYAHNFYWLRAREGTVGFISLGTVYAYFINSTLRHKDTSPCGFVSTDLHMKGVDIGKDYRLVVYGNVPGINNGTDAFAVCVLNMSAGLQMSMKFVFNYTLSLTNGDDSVNVIRTEFDANGFPVVLDNLFLDGSRSDGKTAIPTLWCLDLNVGTLLFSMPRTINERYNMPIFMNGATHEHVAVTSGAGYLEGLRTNDQGIEWSCQTQGEGCAGTPVTWRGSTGAIGRLICVSTKSSKRIIALDVGDPSVSGKCKLAWAEELDMPVDMTTMNSPISIITDRDQLEPFVAVQTTDGTSYTMSYRSNVEPPPATYAPPTAAPTLPPKWYPGPQRYVTTQPPYGLLDISVRTNAAITDFDKTGPVVSAVVGCEIPKKQKIFNVKNKKSSYTSLQMDKSDHTLHAKMQRVMSNRHASSLSTKEEREQEVGILEAATVFYYETVPTTSLKDPDYGFFILPINVFMRTPMAVYSYNSQYAAISPMENGDKDIIVLRTIPGRTGGAYEFYSRYGATNKVATDGEGNFFYTKGVWHEQEHLVSMKQNGNGKPTTTNWQVDFEAPAKQGFKNLTSYMGDLLYARGTGLTEYVIFSRLNVLTFYNTQTGASVKGITDPCMFKPTANSWEKFYPMELYALRGPNNNAVLSVIDTWKQYGSLTMGMCAVSLDSGLPLLHSFLAVNTTWVANVQPVGTKDVYVADQYDNDFAGELVGYDLATGRKLWTNIRENAVGDTIYGVPGTAHFATNMDVQDEREMLMSMVHATSGKVAGKCDFGCEEFTVVADSAGRWIVVCSVYGFRNIVRGIYFDPAFNCNVEWEVDVGASVISFSSSTFKLDDGNLWFSLLTEDGYVYTASPDKWTPPAPPPNTHPTPAQTLIVGLEKSQWVEPVTLVPPVVQLESQRFWYGAVAFVTVDSGVNDTMYSAASAASSSSEVGAAVRNTYLIAYQVEPGPGDVLPPPYLFSKLSVYTNTYTPTIVASNSEYTAAAYTTRSPSDGWIVVIAYPITKFDILRYGAFSAATTDGDGSFYYASGTQVAGGAEAFIGQKIVPDGAGKLKLSETFTYPLLPPTKVTLHSSHVGDPLFTRDGSKSYVSFSFWDTLYTLDTATGVHVAKTKQPCGFVSPTDPYNNDAPEPMVQLRVQLPTTNKNVTVAFVNAAKSVAFGSWGLCALDATGTTKQWSIVLSNIKSFNAITSLSPVGSPFLLVDAVDSGKGGILYGVDAANQGTSWVVTRAKSAGKGGAPVGLPPNSEFFVANMDHTISGGGATKQASYLTLVKSATGKTEGYCNFACKQTPTSATAPEGHQIFVCSEDIFPNILRAVYFDKNKANACVIYWEKEFDTDVESVSVSDYGQVSASLLNGATATSSVVNNVSPYAPSTPSPHGGNNNGNNNKGLSGGVVAAIVILVLLGVVVTAGGIYLIRRRNVRRSAISEAASGLQYGQSQDTSTAGTGSAGGYGAIG